MIRLFVEPIRTKRWCPRCTAFFLVTFSAAELCWHSNIPCNIKSFLLHKKVSLLWIHYVDSDESDRPYHNINSFWRLKSSNEKFPKTPRPYEISLAYSSLGENKISKRLLPNHTQTCLQLWQYGVSAINFTSKANFFSSFFSPALQTGHFCWQV